MTDIILKDLLDIIDVSTTTFYVKSRSNKIVDTLLWDYIWESEYLTRKVNNIFPSNDEVEGLHLCVVVEDYK